MIAGVAAFLGALFAIVLLHEAGHLLAARRVGMPASVFSVGFGPRLWGVRWRGTDYRLSAIPFGGYVRIDPMEEIVEGPGGATTRFDRWPLRARLLVVVAGILANLALAGAVWVAVPLVWGVAQPSDVRVSEVDVEALPEGAGGWASLPADVRVEAVGGRPVDAWSDFYLAVAGSRPGPLVLTLEDGTSLRAVLPPGDDAKLAVLKALHPARPATVAGPPLAAGTSPGGPALAAGERIVRVDGVPVTSWAAWRLHLAAADPSGPLEVVMAGVGGRREVRLTVAAARSLERVDVRRRVGLAGAFRAAGSSLVSTLEIVRESWTILLQGRLSVRQVSGPLAIAGEAARIFASGWEPFLRFVAFLSLNIALVNALPVPALDGGFLALLALEAVRRRPLPAPVQAYLGRVGAIWLCLVMAGTLVNDLLRIAGR